MDFFKYNKQLLSQSQKIDLNFFKELLSNEEVDDRILEWGGQLALENQYWSVAEDLFSCLLERRKKVSDLVYLSEALLNQFQLKEAEECLHEALEQIMDACPLLFKINKYLGQLYMANKNYPMAEEFFNKAYTLNSESPSLQFHRALLKIKEKKYTEAEGLFAELVKTFPDYPKAWLGLAIARHSLGHEEVALACLSRCLDLDPNNQKASYLKEKWNPYKFLTPLQEHFKFLV